MERRSHGIYINESSNNNLLNNSVSTNKKWSYGFYIDSSLNNNFNNNTVLTNGSENSQENAMYGFYIDSSLNNNFNSNTILTYSSYGYGFRLKNSSKNILTNNHLSTGLEGGASYVHGMYFESSSNNSIVNNNISVFSPVTGHTYGIYLEDSSNNNNFTNNFLDNVYTESQAYIDNVKDFYSLDSEGNIIQNMTFTNFSVSFTYSKGIQLDFYESTTEDPVGSANLSKYLKITNIDEDSWVLINVTYSHDEVPEGYNASNVVFMKYYSLVGDPYWVGAHNSKINYEKNYTFMNVTESITLGVFALKEYSTSITNCTVINLPGIYSLQNDVSSEGTCFTIISENVTLDCEGFTINSSSSKKGRGVLSNQYNTTVKNCFIRIISIPGINTFGVSFLSANNGLIYNNTIFTTEYDSQKSNNRGIYLREASNNNLTNNNISIHHSSSQGIHLEYDCLNNTISNNNILISISWGRGIAFRNSFNNNITNNNISILSVNSNGIIFRNSSLNRINDNNVSILGTTLSANNSVGVLFYEFSDSNILINNFVSSFQGLEFSSADSENNEIQNMTLKDFSVSFTYSGGIRLKHTNAPDADPENYSNISKYLNYTNVSDAWIFINFTYSDDEIPEGYHAGNVKPQNYYGDIWNQIIVSGTNREGNYTYANVTNSGIISPMAGNFFELTDCSIISSSGIHYLQNNVFSTGNCFNITTSDIILDCNQFNITGNEEGSGIFLNSVNNITVVNCTVTNFSIGVHFSNSTNSTIINNNLNENFLYGFYIDENSTANLENSNFQDNDAYGIISESLGDINWTISDRARCINNNITIWTNGKNITFEGGELEVINCNITIDGDLIISSDGTYISLYEMLGRVQLDWENDYTDIFGENMTFVSGLLNLSGTANLNNETGSFNWTISLYQNESEIINESLCFGTDKINSDDFCVWNTTEYCSFECEDFYLVLTARNETGDYNYTVYNITIDNLPPDVGNVSINDDFYTINASVNISDTYLSYVSSYLFNSSFLEEEIVGGYLYRAWFYLLNKTQSGNPLETLPESGEFEVSWDKKIYSINETLVSVYSMGFCEDYLFVPGCFDEEGTKDYNCTNWWVAFNSTAVGDDYKFLGIWNSNWFENDLDCIINDTLISNSSIFLLQLDYFNSSGDEEDFNDRWVSSNETNISLYNMTDSSELNLNLTRESVISGKYSFMFGAWDFTDFSNGNALKPFEFASGLNASVSKTLLNEGNVLLGDTVQYLINITNTGEVNISNISLVDNWDTGLNYSFSNLTGNITNYTSRTTNWQNILSENLEPGDSFLVYVNFSAIVYASQVFNLVNITVTGNEDSLNETNSLSITIYNALGTCETISSSGTHYLNKDISSEGTCITINASNVTLDCQGHTINHSLTGIGTHGLIAENQTEITIKNCIINQANNTINNITNGIYFSNVTNSTIYNNTIILGNSSDISSGIYFGKESIYGNISYNTINVNSEGTCFGIHLKDESNYTNIHNNKLIISGNTTSFGICMGTTDTNVSNCNIFTNTIIAIPGTNGSSAIFLSGADNLIYNNIFNSSDLDFYIGGTFVTDKPFYSYNNYSNSLNTTKISGTNIVGKNHIGGNYYTNHNSTGYSDTCTEATGDYICDGAYVLDSNNIDYLPLTTSTTYEEGENGNGDTNGNGGNGGGGGGGDGGGDSPQVTDTDDEEEYEPVEWEQNYSYDSEEFSEIEFVNEKIGEKERIILLVGGNEHYVGVVDVGEDSALIEVASTPVRFRLSINEIKKVDVTKDDYYDLEVILNAIEDGKVDLTINSIREAVPIPETTDIDIDEEEPPRSLLWLFIVLIILVVVIIIAGVIGFVVYQKQKNV